MEFEMDTRTVVANWRDTYQLENVSYGFSEYDGLILYADLRPEHRARIAAQIVPIKSLVTEAEMKVCLGWNIPLCSMPKARLSSVDPLEISGSVYVIDMFLRLLFVRN